MNVECVAVIPQCPECGKVWLPADETRCQAYWIDDDPEHELIFYALGVQSASSHS